MFNTNGGSGALDTADFVFSIAGGSATLSSAAPISISASSNTYTLGIGLSGLADGTEVITVKPVANAIFDGGYNAASTTQSNNTRNLYEKVLPIISGSTIAGDNSTVTVTFAEPVFPGHTYTTTTTSGTWWYTGSGNLDANDFVFSIAGGVATLGSTTPTSISKSGNAYTLGINVEAGTQIFFPKSTSGILTHGQYSAT